MLFLKIVEHVFVDHLNIVGPFTAFDLHYLAKYYVDDIHLIILYTKFRSH